MLSAKKWKNRYKYSIYLFFFLFFFFCLFVFKFYFIFKLNITVLDLPNIYSSAGRKSTCNVGDLGSIPGLGRSPGEGKGYPLQYSGLENSMDCIVHEMAKSQTRLSNFHFHKASMKHLFFNSAFWYTKYIIR